MGHFHVFALYRFINFGHDHYQERENEGMKLMVFTDRTGKLFDELWFALMVLNAV